MGLLERLKTTRFSELIRHLLLSWLIAVAVEWLRLDSTLSPISLKGIAAMSFPRLLAVTAGLTLFFWAFSRFLPSEKKERRSMVVFYLALCIFALISHFSWGFLLIALFPLAAFVVYAVMGSDLTPEQEVPQKKVHWIYPVLTGVLAVSFFIIVSLWTVSRVKTFSTPNFDFGIFAQMFHQMKETGLPMTTIERDGLLSHFAVHVSPVFYLILPVYWLFPFPATLQVMQALILASSVIPLWLLCKHHGLSGLQRTLICAVLLLLPAVSGGTSYDIHENCFLLPLLLWLMYAIDSRRLWLIAVSALLTLSVKEDAAVYVAVAALYLIIRTLLRFRKALLKDLLTGIGLLLVALIWFYLTTNYLATQGDGVMTGRYSNFNFDGSGSLIAVIKAVLLSPLHMLSICVQEDRPLYIMQTLLPLLGLPLLTRKFDRYLLLIPYILVNLMADWPYQYDIYFQYGFGSTAFLIYLTLVNVKDLKLQPVRLIALGLSVAVSLGFFIGYISIPKASYYPKLYRENQTYYDTIAEKLDQVPTDAAVTAHVFYGAHLSSRDVLYDIRYCAKEHITQSDYVVIKNNYEAAFDRFEENGENGYENFVAFLTEHGFVLADSYTSLEIYKKH